MRSRRLPVLVAVAVTVAGTTVGVGVWRQSREEWPRDGPVEVPPPHGYVVRYQVGQVFTDGWERISLTGDEPAVLRGVELVGPGVDHFRIVGLLLAGKDRTIGAIQTVPGFPPRVPRRWAHLHLGHRPLGPLVSAIGARIPAGQLGSALQIGLKVVKPGLAIRTGVRIHYTVGDHQYSAELPGYLANCPRGMTLEECQQAYLDLE